jgi:predicted PurR-regulated permease PerM
LLTRGDMSPNRRWLPEIVFLLWILVFALLSAFCYFESSLCITLLLATFLAIVVDPLIVWFERWHISRVVSTAIVILSVTLLIASVAYVSYSRVSDVVDDMPEYARRVGEMARPITSKIEKLQDSAGRLSAEVPTRRVPVVRVKTDYPEWTSYLIRGVGPISGAILIIGIVPFLMFFLLIQKEQLKQKLWIVWGDRVDVGAVTTRVTEMVRGFVIGNLVIGLLMAMVTAGVLAALKMDGAVILGMISGFLNLVPFLGAILASVVLVGAALVQNQAAGAIVALLATVVVVHTVSANYLVPHFIGRRVSISPVAATVGILFWGWLWGFIGVLLAVPLTAFVKIVADAHPALGKIANVLAERPTMVPARKEKHAEEKAGLDYRAEPTHANK